MQFALGSTGDIAAPQPIIAGRFFVKSAITSDELETRQTAESSCRG
jgi:hypothetical protein